MTACHECAIGIEEETSMRANFKAKFARREAASVEHSCALVSAKTG